MLRGRNASSEHNELSAETSRGSRESEAFAMDGRGSSRELLLGTRCTQQQLVPLRPEPG